MLKIKATNTHSEYVTLIIYPRQKYLRELVCLVYVNLEFLKYCFRKIVF
jgi:hypothetical protein